MYELFGHMLAVERMRSVSSFSRLKTEIRKWNRMSESPDHSAEWLVSIGRFVQVSPNILR